MSSAYRIDYEGSFSFGLTAAELWRELGRVDRYERWWPWMRSVELRGQGIEPGAEIEFAIVSPLPHRMRVTVEIVETAARERVSVRVHGDLEGTAELSLVGAGPQTEVRLRWSVEIMDRGMRAAALVARPLVRWAHDWAIDVALRGFRKSIEADAR